MKKRLFTASALLAVAILLSAASYPVIMHALQTDNTTQPSFYLCKLPDSCYTHAAL